MKDTEKQMYVSVRETALQLIAAHEELRERIDRCNSCEEIADIMYATTQAFKFAEEMVKELRATKTRGEHVFCLLWMKDRGDEEKIRTDHVTATPKCDIMAALPKMKDGEPYVELMKALGVDDTAIAGDFVRPHWPKVMEWLSGLTAKGLPLPKGIDPEKTYPKYAVGLRKRKGVEE